MSLLYIRTEDPWATHETYGLVAHGSLAGIQLAHGSLAGI